MKSAYELAMERLAKVEPAQTLTESQRSELNELSNRYEAKIAERQTFLQGKLQTAEAAGDMKEVEELSLQLRRDLGTLREELEAKKKAIWDQK
jgi:hypothetical protein